MAQDLRMSLPRKYRSRESNPSRSCEHCLLSPSTYGGNPAGYNTWRASPAAAREYTPTSHPHDTSRQSHQVIRLMTRFWRLGKPISSLSLTLGVVSAGDTLHKTDSATWQRILTPTSGEAQLFYRDVMIISYDSTSFTTLAGSTPVSRTSSP